MKVLIDTHIAIWAVLNDPKLPKKARDIILNRENGIFYSTASVWEITIKHMLHPDKLRITGNLLEKGCEENGYIVLPILNKHVSVLETLKRSEDAPKHNDPFDRILAKSLKTGASGTLNVTRSLFLFVAVCISTRGSYFFSYSFQIGTLPARQNRMVSKTLVP